MDEKELRTRADTGEPDAILAYCTARQRRWAASPLGDDANSGFLEYCQDVEPYLSRLANSTDERGPFTLVGHLLSKAAILDDDDAHYAVVETSMREGALILARLIHGGRRDLTILYQGVTALASDAVALFQGDLKREGIEIEPHPDPEKAISEVMQLLGVGPGQGSQAKH